LRNGGEKKTDEKGIYLGERRKQNGSPGKGERRKKEVHQRGKEFYFSPIGREKRGRFLIPLENIKRK